MKQSSIRRLTVTRTGRLVMSAEENKVGTKGISEPNRQYQVDALSFGFVQFQEILS